MCHPMSRQPHLAPGSPGAGRWGWPAAQSTLPGGSRLRARRAEEILSLEQDADRLGVPVRCSSSFVTVSQVEEAQPAPFLTPRSQPQPHTCRAQCLWTQCLCNFLKIVLDGWKHNDHSSPNSCLTLGRACGPRVFRAHCSKWGFLLCNVGFALKSCWDHTELSFNCRLTDSPCRRDLCVFLCLCASCSRKFGLSILIDSRLFWETSQDLRQESLILFTGKPRLLLNSSVRSA